MSLCVLGVVTGILCGIWAELAMLFGLISWAGFAGCTTYFAFNEHGFKGVKMTVLCNLSGIASGMLIIYLGSIISFTYSVGIFCGIVTVLMCWLGHVKHVAFIPGIFMGCFSTFAANGDWQLLAVSMVCGAVLGLLCDRIGTKGYEVLARKMSWPAPGDACNEENT